MRLFLGFGIPMAPYVLVNQELLLFFVFWWFPRVVESIR